MTHLEKQPLERLSTTELPWLKIRDHFIATVGARSGTGRRLGPLLVLADATFAPRSRFPMHPHKDMEILSIVLEGELSHHGDQAHGGIVRPRGAQLISSRDGMFHAEGNDTDGPTRMLQIWFEPNERGGEAAYFDRQLPEAPGRYVVAGDEGMPMRADARVDWIDLGAGEEATIELAGGRLGYLLSLDGDVEAAGTTLRAGEGADAGPGVFTVRAQNPAAVLWIEVAA